jgi:rhodanese-related sulfurtransferase
MRILRHVMTFFLGLALIWSVDWTLDRMATAWSMDLPGVQGNDLPIRFTFLSPTQLKQLIEEGRPFTLLDVREEGEFRSGHIVDAINIPYHQLRQQTNKLDRNKPVVVYCIKAGRRSIIAANALSDLGFAEVYNVDGGIAGWEKAFPLEVVTK